MKKKIGIITTWFDRGASYVSKAYVDALKADFDIGIYARGGEEFPLNDPRWNQEYVYWSEFVPGGINTQVDLEDFQIWLSRFEPDVLLFNEQQSWEVILWCKLNLEIPIGSYIDYYTHDTVPLFDAFDFLCCNTKRHHSVFQDHHNAWYIPWGVDLNQYNTPLELETDHPIFFHSAGFSPFRKGTDLVLEAFLKMEYEASLVIHIQHSPSQHDSLLPFKNIANIQWITETIPPPGAYHFGHIYVYPSRLDGLGLSLPEAIASGLYALVPDEAPMNEFIENGVNGETIEVVKKWTREDGYYWDMNQINTQAMSKAMDNIAKAWKDDPKRKSKIHCWAEKNLDWKQNSNQLAAMIQQIPPIKLNKTTQEALEKMIAKQHPKASTKDIIHRKLIQFGARKIKRAIFGRK